MMRLLIQPDSRKLLFNYLKAKNNCHSLSELARKLNISFGNIQNWAYRRERYIPESFIPIEIKEKIKITDKQKENWGSVKGGKKTYKILIEKYGIQEIRKRQSNGGKKASSNLHHEETPLNIDLKNAKFLEFYGALLGDGWLSKLKYKNKVTNLIGISGHLIKDKEFHFYCKICIQNLFERNPYIKEIPRYNGRELLFSHKSLHEFLSNDLGFPIGLKKNLELNKKILGMGYDKVKYVIRGIFDTDGSFYYDKTPSGKPYPCISISMKEPILMKQIHEILLENGFKAYFNSSKNVPDIVLKGSIQLKKWMIDIGSSNPYKLNKMKNALVAQFG